MAPDDNIHEMASPSPYSDEKSGFDGDEIEVSKPVGALTQSVQEKGATPEMRARIAEYYGAKAEEDEIAPRADITAIVDRIMEMTNEEAVDILTKTIHAHRDDPNFPSQTMDKIQQLVNGPKACDMDESDWSFDVRAEASVIYYHSPYPEVRSVTVPYDDPDTPVETIRSYTLGLIFMAGATALNTFFSPRQPAISLSGQVLQLLLAPCGFFWARFFPDWGFHFRGKRISLNPGPWTFKEQMFATIIFTVASGAGGTYYVYLVQMLPQYLDQKWVTFNYEICLALSVQFFGFGFAGILRRFVIYPVTALWFSVLPTLALNRALVMPEKKEVINGWKLSRYRFFMICFALMFIWFWVPNTLFTALHAFNWMTWIAPQNFNLGMITGFYGGMGFNPWATFDWNVSGTGSLVTPWWSNAQQYVMRVVSGLIIIGMYWGNYVWSAYTPINSNESFDNKGGIYNVTIVSNGHGGIDMDAYKKYGPPYFSGANVFGQGGWFAWYPMTLFFIFIRYWEQIKKCTYEMYRSFRYRTSIWEGNDDAHCRMMRKYPEVPDWWFLCILALSAGLGIAALKAWSTETPWWIPLAVIGMSAILLVPSAILVAASNVGMGFNVLFQLLAGLWFPGNAEAEIIITAFGSNFDSQTDNYMSEQKLAHYSKLPPRAIFRGQMLAVFLNCFIFIGMLNWMVANFDNGTLCTWANPGHFVCTDAVLVFASAIEYGALGVRNMFILYPILPWCFLMGAAVGIIWGLAFRYGSAIRSTCQRRMSEARFDVFERFLFKPCGTIGILNPSVLWAGALNWTGGNNLSYATNGLYISFIFMYYIKRHYRAWWEKYNYLLEAGFDVGVAISGIFQTLVLGFGENVSINWWGNSVSTAGVDYQSYNQNSTLLPIPKVGYFGLAPDQYPMDF